MSTREDIYKRLEHIKIDLERGNYTQAKQALEAAIGAVETVHKRPMPEDITIIGKRWFQRSYGNTYHSVTIKVKGADWHYIPMQYGYDEQYLQSAHEWFMMAGYDVPEDYSAFKGLLKGSYWAVDVQRKRDL